VLNLFDRFYQDNKLGLYIAFLLLLPIILLIGLEPKLEIAIAGLFFYALVASYFSFAGTIIAALIITASLSLISSVYISIFAALVYLLLAIPINQISKKKTKPIKTTEIDNSSWQIEGLSDIISNAQMRDSNTQNHSERVAQNSLVIANYMSLSERQTKTLYWSALLHDIGKESIPVEILNKTSALSNEEFEIIKNHANYGADVLASISPDYGEIAEIVRYHHEKWDGSGYPKNLIAQEIPILSRIIAVADVFEALTSKRSYKEPMRAVDAAKYIINHSGSHFDPQIVKVFEICFSQKLLQVADAAITETIDLLYDSQVSEEFSQAILELK